MGPDRSFPQSESLTNLGSARIAYGNPRRQPVPVEEDVPKRDGGGEVGRERTGEPVEAEAERVERRQVP